MSRETADVVVLIGRAPSAGQWSALVRVPRAEGSTTAQAMARDAGLEWAEVHDGDCALGKVAPNTVCTCRPINVHAPAVVSVVGSRKLRRARG